MQKVQVDKTKTKSARKLHQIMEKGSDFICGIIVAQEILRMLVVKIVHMMIEYRV